MTITKKVTESWPSQRLDLGYTGENEYRTVVIDATEWAADWPGCTFALVYTRHDGYTPTPVINVFGTLINWTITAEDTEVPGTGSMELRLLSGDVIGKSATLPCVVRASVKTGDPPPASLPDRIDQLIQAGTTALAKAAEALASAEAAAQSEQSAAGAAAGAAASEQTATEKADAAVAAATQAVNAAAQAVQAMTDLLAMLGNDIATLVGGKIPLSQIPATATQEIYAITSENELTGLTAQRGDLAELIEDIGGEQTITKTWQCLGDASVRANWVVWGTSYAVQAGSATLATDAVNADKINGKRMVAMTQSQYDAAALDADTYYVVTPDPEA